MTAEQGKPWPTSKQIDIQMYNQQQYIQIRSSLTLTQTISNSHECKSLDTRFYKAYNNVIVCEIVSNKRCGREGSTVKTTSLYIVVDSK